MSRPTVFTKQTLQKLEYAFALDCTDEEACIYADIAPSSLYNFEKENGEFLERKQLLHHTPILKARIEIVEGLKGNPNLALKYLERKKRNEFGDNLDITTMGEKLPIIIPEALARKYDDDTTLGTK